MARKLTAAEIVAAQAAARGETAPPPPQPQPEADSRTLSASEPTIAEVIVEESDR